MAEIFYQIHCYQCVEKEILEAGGIFVQKDADIFEHDFTSGFYQMSDYEQRNYYILTEHQYLYLLDKKFIDTAKVFKLKKNKQPGKIND